MLFKCPGKTDGNKTETIEYFTVKLGTENCAKFAKLTPRYSYRTERFKQEWPISYFIYDISPEIKVKTRFHYYEVTDIEFRLFCSLVVG